MHVAGGNHRLIELLTQAYDLTVDLLKILLGLYFADLLAVDHKGIVSKRLDFQIIIVIYNPCDPLL